MGAGWWRCPRKWGIFGTGDMSISIFLVMVDLRCFNGFLMVKSLTWIEILPDQCPPKDALHPCGATFYRLTDSFPPNETDFLPTVIRFPRDKCPVDPCIEKSVSIWDDLQCMMNRAGKIGTLKTKKPVSFILSNESGVVKKTFGKGHCSWWRYADFTPLSTCNLSTL